MPNTSQVLSGVGQGALAGSAFGPTGTIIGGGVGLLSSLFSKSPEQEWEEYVNDLKKYVAEYNKNLEVQRQKQLTEGSQRIGKLTGGLTKRFRSDAGRRASALGRVSDIESFELPVVEKVATAGSDSMQNFLTQTNQQFDNRILDENQVLMQARSGKPRSETPLDIFGAVAPAVGQFGQNENYLDILMQTYGVGKYAKNTLNAPDVNVDMSWLKNTQPVYDIGGYN